jgi:hypothetical protein
MVQPFTMLPNVLKTSDDLQMLKYNTGKPISVPQSAARHEWELFSDGHENA